ncbi:MAG: hypothetical protein ACKO5K_03450 [Armatimonadota bacterium]
MIRDSDLAAVASGTADPELERRVLSAVLADMALRRRFDHLRERIARGDTPPEDSVAERARRIAERIAHEHGDSSASKGTG